MGIQIFPRKNAPKKIEEENMRTSQSVGVPHRQNFDSFVPRAR
jgi:hypothetical protein